MIVIATSGQHAIYYCLLGMPTEPQQQARRRLIFSDEGRRSPLLPRHSLNIQCGSTRPIIAYLFKKHTVSEATVHLDVS